MHAYTIQAAMRLLFNKHSVQQAFNLELSIYIKTIELHVNMYLCQIVLL